MAINRDVLLRARASIAKDPVAHMFAWKHDCGTGCCIAGHIVCNEGYIDSSSRFPHAAGHLAGLTVSEMSLGPMLFWPQKWPESFSLYYGVRREGMLRMLDEILGGYRDPDTLAVLKVAPDHIEIPELRPAAEPLADVLHEVAIERLESSLHMAQERLVEVQEMAATYL